MARSSSITLNPSNPFSLDRLETVIFDLYARSTRIVTCNNKVIDKVTPCLTYVIYLIIKSSRFMKM